MTTYSPYSQAPDALEHYGVKGMKWGIRKDKYQSLDRKGRKAVRKKYWKSPEGKVTKATISGTVLLGPIGGVIAGLAVNQKLRPNSKVSKLNSAIVKKGERKVNSMLDNRTDEEKITELMNKHPDMKDTWDYYFDESGKLFYAAPKRQ